MSRTDNGFTLIELLVVILIVGVLAAIAIPKFTRQRDNAYVTAMKSDLRNLVAVQETFKADSARYAPSLSLLTHYRPSSGVTVTIGQSTTEGWAATASHSATTRTCAIFIGTGVTPSGANEGEPACN